MGPGTLGEIRDGSVDPPRSSGRVTGPSERFETGRGTHLKVRDESGATW